MFTTVNLLRGISSFVLNDYFYHIPPGGIDLINFCSGESRETRRSEMRQQHNKPVAAGGIESLAVLQRLLAAAQPERL
jgi:hypothetical protein